SIHTLSLHDALPICVTVNTSATSGCRLHSTSRPFCSRRCLRKANRGRMQGVVMASTLAKSSTTLLALALVTLARSCSVKESANRSEEHTSELQSPDH